MTSPTPLASPTLYARQVPHPLLLPDAPKPAQAALQMAPLMRDQVTACAGVTHIRCCKCSVANECKECAVPNPKKPTEYAAGSLWSAEVLSTKCAANVFTSCVWWTRPGCCCDCLSPVIFPLKLRLRHTSRLYPCLQSISSSYTDSDDPFTEEFKKM